MKAVTVTVLKKELRERSHQELIDICLTLAKFKKENKELLTYLLFDANDEDAYINSVKKMIDTEFSALNKNHVYYVKKGVRKILRMIKKFIRYSKKKETETELLLYFCAKIKQLKPTHKRNRQIINMYDQQLRMAKKAMEKLHEDLQYDFVIELEQLEKA